MFSPLKDISGASISVLLCRETQAKERVSYTNMIFLIGLLSIVSIVSAGERKCSQDQILLFSITTRRTVMYSSTCIQYIIDITTIAI